jgi:PhnB protein
MLMRFGDAPGGEAGCADGSAPPADKVMHASIRIGSTEVMLSDGFGKGNPVFQGVHLSLSADNDADAKRMFDGLADGGVITQALEPSFFASQFGMLTDRFGVSWMVLNPLPMPG